MDARGQVFDFARNAYSGSELAGVCFAPDGSALFANMQQDGVTLAIEGPLDELFGAPPQPMPEPSSSASSSGAANGGSASSSASGSGGAAGDGTLVVAASLVGAMALHRRGTKPGRRSR